MRRNGFIESFNGKLRHECRNEEAFASLAEIERWRFDYNHISHPAHATPEAIRLNPTVDAGDQPPHPWHPTMMEGLAA